jgi:lipopolysaccharide biosynthesis regulator YciM
MQANPESKYLPQVLPQLFLAYRQAGNLEKAVAFAEGAIAKNQADEDMLLVAADYYMNTKKDPAKVLDLSSKLVAMMETKPAPQGVSAADWETKKKNMLGPPPDDGPTPRRANWLRPTTLR